MSIKEFVYQIREYGFKVAVGNLFICWLKSFIGAKRIRINYGKK